MTSRHDPAPAAVDDQPVGSSAQKPGGARSVTAGDRDMGSALRSVYQSAVDEAVPDDLLDLLGKLD